MAASENRYTAHEVAERLGVKVSTVYAMLSRGEIQAYHQGKRRIFTETQLNQYLAARRSVVLDMTYACGPALKLT